EDIAIADPQAVHQATAAWDVYERLGSPEGELAIAQAVVYLATAPKSVAVYSAFNAAKRLAKTTGSLMPPANILNAPTKLMKDLGYGEGYEYDPHTPGGFSGANYFPEEMEPERLYRPTGNGYERIIAEKLAEWHRMRAPRRPRSSILRSRFLVLLRVLRPPLRAHPMPFGQFLGDDALVAVAGGPVQPLRLHLFGEVVRPRESSRPVR